ncbi:MAG: divalent-cation tolerance protein CutA [Anaerolineae bacterium]
MVLITAPSPEVGAQIADALLSAKLVACVNIVPAVNSLYTWQGAVHNDAETLLIVKTTAAVFQEKLVPAVQALHPYDVPEIIALPILMGSQPYLDWIAESVSA